MAIGLGAERQTAAINVTPLIDVLLVLLIIFMAIAPEKQIGLNAVIPQAPDQMHPHPPDTSVVLSIAADGSYRLNSQPVVTNALAARLTEVFARRSQRVLFVQAEPGLEFQSVATAIDTAHGVNIDRVALLPRASVSP